MQLRSALDCPGLRQLDFFGGIFRTNILCYAPTETEVRLEGEFEHFLNFCGECVGTDDNANLSGPQKRFIVSLEARHPNVLDTRADERSTDERTFRKGITVAYHHQVQGKIYS